MPKRVEFTAVANLESAHSVVEQKGNHEALHGHSWKVTVRWAAENKIEHKVIENENSSFLNIISDLDHVNLNEVAQTENCSSTAEAVAKMIFERLKPEEPQIRLIAVQVEEEPDCCISYYGKNE